jgi:hypothetical protein
MTAVIVVVVVVRATATTIIRTMRIPMMKGKVNNYDM